MNQELEAALAARYPDLKDWQVTRAVNKYVAGVTAEVALQMALGNSDERGISFACDAVRERCGRLKVGGATRYVFHVMQEHPSTQLVHVTYTGNNLTEQVSRVMLTPRYKGLMLQAIRQDTLSVELKPEHLDDVAVRANRRIPVNRRSLDSYIMATRETLKQPGLDEPYVETLTRNLRIATLLRDRLEVDEDGGAYSAEYWEETDSGRQYGHGLSLQRLPRHVRNAALGPCHKYDFKASSYALMTALALKINPELHVGAIKDYVKHRKAIRQRIAADVGVSANKIKEVFTALGFGAKANDNPHSYVRGELGHECYERLMMNEEFAYIRLQFEAVNATILDCPHFKAEGFEMFGRVYNDAHPKTGLKRSRAQKLAWIYQCMESEALRVFVSLLDETPLLTAHDCVFLRKRLALSIQQDVMYQLNQQFSLLTFEHDPVTPIAHLLPADDSRQRHSVALEEWRARNYACSSEHGLVQTSA